MIQLKKLTFALIIKLTKRSGAAHENCEYAKGERPKVTCQDIHTPTHAATASRIESLFSRRIDRKSERQRGREAETESERERQG